MGTGYCINGVELNETDLVYAFFKVLLAKLPAPRTRQPVLMNEELTRILV